MTSSGQGRRAWQGRVQGEGEGEGPLLTLYLLEINKYTWIIYFPKSRV
jgi:hypothetical protein